MTKFCKLKMYNITKGVVTLMEIYIDVLLLENFLVNFFLIYVTIRTVRIYCDLKRVYLSAFIGSLSCIIVLLYPMNSIMQLIMKFGVAFVMLWIPYGNKFSAVIKALLIFIMYSMVLAGMCIFIKFNEMGFLPTDKVILDFSYKKLLLAIMIIFVFIDRIVIYIRDRKDLHKLVYNIDICFDEYKKSIRAFLDTGNELREPVTNLPVILVEESMFELMKFEEKSMFTIPYRVVDGSKGKLYGIKPRRVDIHLDDDNIESKQVIIAFCKEKLSTTGDFNALLSRGIL